MDELKAAVVFGRTCALLYIDLTCDRGDHPALSHCGVVELSISNDGTWTAHLEKVTCPNCRRHFESLMPLMRESA